MSLGDHRQLPCGPAGQIAAVTATTATIGITGSYGGLNRGDEAILTSMVASLRDRLPGVELTVFSRNAQDTRLRHDVDRVVPVREITRAEIEPEVERLDLLLLGGGGILHDGEAHVYLREVLLAQQHEVPTMAYAVGAGPLEQRHERQAVRRALAGMGAVTVRDCGARRLLEDIGVERRVEVTADPALLLAPVPFRAEQLAAEGVAAGRPLVGMSIREPGTAAPNLDVDTYATVLAHTADFICDRYGAEIVFIPMERVDIRLSHVVISRMMCAEHAHVLKGDYAPGELLGLMAHLDFVIAARLHVLIFAAISGTPFVPLRYAAKVTDFVQTLGVAAPGPVTRDCAGALLAAVDRAWDERHLERWRLRRSVGAVRRRAQQTLEIALDCLHAPVPAAPEPVLS
jgi:polysaccharide pyruvyl transferase CsaB